MCGIAGYVGPTVDGLLDRMISGIRHRGPDGQGDFVANPVHLGHARLAIIDIAGGTQPMVCDGGRLIIVYNGEVYNFVELRAELERRGVAFTTDSDTEVIPLGYKLFGPDFFARMIGIFAFALVDLERKRLFLVRDHFGIKPLYYARTAETIVFSSCARAVALHPGVDRSLNVDAIRDYLQFRYVPNGKHFFAGIETLPPATILEYGFNGSFETRTYWSPRRREPSHCLDVESWVEQTGALLDDSNRIQLRSDVPVGLFLSGGVDSSTIATFATRHAAYPMTAYTYAMEQEHDEVAAAEVIARRVRARHVVVRGEGQSGLAGYYKAIACMDHPVGDAIIVPTYRLCEAAARDLKVVLTGEGADEIFGGYLHFAALMKLGRLARLFPPAPYFSGLINLLPIGLLDHFFDYQASLGRLGRSKVRRMVASVDSPRALYRLANSVIDDDDIGEATLLGPPPGAEPELSLTLSDLMAETMHTWLPNQILNKMDQLSMIHGLEARVPFLDPRIYDHLLTAPDAAFVNGEENKVLLRKILRRENAANAERPKFAFHVPVEDRHRDELEALCKEWLGEESIARHGILNKLYVRDNIAALQQGEFLASKRLMTMVGLHMWLDAHAN